MSWKKQSAEAGLAGLSPREAALGALWDETMVKKMPDPLGQILDLSRVNVTERGNDKYLASFGVEFCSFLLLYCPPVTVAINNSQPLVYTFIPHLFQI